MGIPERPAIKNLYIWIYFLAKGCLHILNFAVERLRIIPTPFYYLYEFVDDEQFEVNRKLILQ